ncbi:helix-turn-helix domain-containing protein [Flavobacteriales bacterium]|nr:helix-turn-helix domain-containing protein [Flavobacteriales bacterium]
MKKLGENIRVVREMRNLTQKALASAIGYSQKHVSRIEKGEVQLGDECIKRISKALKVSPQKLIHLDYNSFLKE